MSRVEHNIGDNDNSDSMTTSDLAKYATRKFMSEYAIDVEKYTANNVVTIPFDDIDFMLENVCDISLEFARSKFSEDPIDVSILADISHASYYVSNSGALIVNGGVGIAKDINLGGHHTNTIYNSGAVILEGGVGIAKNLYIGGNDGLKTNRYAQPQFSTATGALMVNSGVGVAHPSYIETYSSRPSPYLSTNTGSLSLYTYPTIAVIDINQYQPTHSMLSKGCVIPMALIHNKIGKMYLRIRVPDRLLPANQNGTRTGQLHINVSYVTFPKSYAERMQTIKRITHNNMLIDFSNRSILPMMSTETGSFEIKYTGTNGTTVYCEEAFASSIGGLRVRHTPLLENDMQNILKHPPNKKYNFVCNDTEIGMTRANYFSRVGKFIEHSFTVIKDCDSICELNISLSQPSQIAYVYGKFENTFAKFEVKRITPTMYTVLAIGMGHHLLTSNIDKLIVAFDVSRYVDNNTITFSGVTCIFNEDYQMKLNNYNSVCGKHTFIVDMSALENIS